MLRLLLSRARPTSNINESVAYTGMRSGPTNLNSTISGNSGHDAGLKVWRKGVFDDQAESIGSMHAPQPGTSKAAPCHKACPYLLRKLAVTRAAQIWRWTPPIFRLFFVLLPASSGQRPEISLLAALKSGFAVCTGFAPIAAWRNPSNPS